MYTNGTTNYNLPQYVDSDKATWTDLNAPFNAIDAAIKSAIDDTAQEALDIDALKTRMNAAEVNIGTNTTDISGLNTRLTTAEGAISAQAEQIADVKNDTEDMICAYNELTATSTHTYHIGDYFRYNDVLYQATQEIGIGDTIVPDTNCETTNVTTELLEIENLSGDVTQLQTDVDQLQTDVDQLQTDVTDLKSRLLNNVPDSGITVLSEALKAASRWIIENVSASDYHRVFFTIDGTLFRISRISDTIIGFTGTRTLVSADEIQIISNEINKTSFTQRAFVIKFNVGAGTTSYVYANLEVYTAVGSIPVYMD